MSTRLPREVGYDDVITELADPPLTAVAPPKCAVGRRAVEVAYQAITVRRAGDERATSEHVRLTPLAIEGTSTAVPPVTGAPSPPQPSEISEGVTSAISASR